MTQPHTDLAGMGILGEQRDGERPASLYPSLLSCSSEAAAVRSSMCIFPKALYANICIHLMFYKENGVVVLLDFLAPSLPFRQSTVRHPVCQGDLVPFFLA